MPIKTVGARELKTRLGRYLRRVRQGHRLVVTDRGQPIAELRPITVETGLDARLAELEAKGLVTRPTAPLGTFQPLVARDPRLADAVREDRADRF